MGGGLGRYVLKEYNKDEYALQYSFNKAQEDKAEEIRKMESGEWLKEQEEKERKAAEEAAELELENRKEADKAKAFKEAQTQMNLNLKDSELFYKAQSDKLKAEADAIKNSRDPNGNLQEYAQKMAQAERNIIASDMAKTQTKIEIEIVSRTPFEDAREKDLEIKELNLELATLTEKAKGVGVALEEITSVASKVSGDDVISAAEQKLGTPYILGADGVSATDCGKYVQDVWNQVGVEWSSRYVPYMIEEAKKKGLWREAGSGYKPKKGDGVFVLGDNHVGMSDGNGGIYHASSSRKKTVHDPSVEAAFGQATGYIALSDLTTQTKQKKQIMTQDAAKEFQKEYLKMVEEGNKILEEAAKMAGDISTYQKKEIEAQYDKAISKFKNNGQMGFAAVAEKVKTQKLWQADFAQANEDLKKSNEDFAEAQTELIRKFTDGNMDGVQATDAIAKKFNAVFEEQIKKYQVMLEDATKRGDDKSVRDIRKKLREVLDKLTDSFKAILDAIDKQTNEEIAKIQLRKDLTTGQKDTLVDEAKQKGLRSKIAAGENEIKQLESQRNGVFNADDDKKIAIAKKQLEQLNYELSQTPTYIDKVHMAGKQGLEDGLNSFFSDVLSGCKGVSAAFQDLANSILQSITKVLANRLTQQFMGMLGGGAKTIPNPWQLSNGTSLDSNFGIGGLLGFADGGNLNEGGKVNGPGTGTSDSILAHVGNLKKFIRIANGEYVIKAAAVKRFGTNFFDHVNNGMIPPEIYRVHEMYANGGSLTGSAVELPNYSATNSINVPVTVNGVSSPAMSSELRSGIEDVVIKILRKYS